MNLTRDWVRRVQPYAHAVLNLLKTAAPIVVPAIDTMFGTGTVKKLGIEANLNLAKELVGRLPSELTVSGTLPEHEDIKSGNDGLLSDSERAGLLALHSLLRNADPPHERLGLRRVPTYTGDYRWLYAKHYTDYQQSFPNEVEQQDS